jgi:hypothetical protein
MRKVLTQTLTSGQLLNLKETPVQIIDAPGTGYVCIPFLIFMRLHAGSIPYGTLSTSLGLISNNIDIFPNQHMSTAFLGSSSDEFVYYVFTNSNLASGINVGVMENQEIYIQNLGVLDLTSGNGTLDIQIQWDNFNL